MKEESNMKKIDNFTNLYSLQKTLRFKLIPIGETEENFNKKLLLEQDRERAKNYKKVKSYIDEYHKYFIEKVLSPLRLENTTEYAELYYKLNKTDSELDKMEQLESDFRKSISKALKNDSLYKKMFGKEMIRELLPEFLTDLGQRKILEQFYDFSTYFTGFFQNRENMYTEEEKSTGIAYRCINDNLPKFLDNAKSFLKVKELLPEKYLTSLNKDFSGLFGVNTNDVFEIDYFSFVLSQSGIDKYNQIIGGYTNKDGSKIQGLNEYVNLYNQHTAKNDKSLRLPFMKPLFKQILTDKETVSFKLEEFENDNDVLKTINDFYINITSDTVKEIKNLFDRINDYNTKGIYVKNGVAVTSLSKAVFDDWAKIKNAWNIEYEQNHPKKKNANEEKYYDNERKAYNAIKSFSISKLQSYGEESICYYYSDSVADLCQKITEAYSNAENLLTNEYKENKRLSANDKAVELIKNLLDSIKKLENLIKPLLGSGKEETKDNVFYGEFLPLFESLALIDKLYDKTRNYMTKKPYSKDKIKLNFENPQFLGGWDKNKEKDYRSVLLEQNEKYYLAIMDKTNSKVFSEIDNTDKNDAVYRKMNYKLLPGPNKMLPKVFFAKSNIDYYAPDERILEIREKESFKKGKNFNIDDCHKFIDFYKASIKKHEDWSKFGFNFKNTSDYSDIGEFYNEIKCQGYSITYSLVSENYINEQIKNGSLYLFQIYSKDFSKYSKGKPNLHTLYFKMLFDEKNLGDVVYKLNGEAEMFYREASIKDEEKIIHPANSFIKNKNPENEKKQSKFEYDLIKDKRFTERQFSLHIPITLNFKSPDLALIDYAVRDGLANEANTNIIGIDRGERNLIYISVINSKGEILKQYSINKIISNNNYTVDYHSLLNDKESERDKARKSWATIGNIKELKEGYISQVVHNICELVVKYDAIIAMEDLNPGFMNSRVKVEKQVYQKFEKMLTKKLNFLADKSIEPDKIGGLLKAYQLTNGAKASKRGKQDGIVFYIPAWLTSKIDPTTGFASLIKAKYTSVASSIDFFGKFDGIRYNQNADMFEFDIDYGKFPRCYADYKQKWTVCSNGERVRTFRNPQKNNEFDNDVVNLTCEYKKMFEKYNIDYSNNLKEQIVSQDAKQFFVDLISLFNLTLQMRNSITGNTDIDYLISPVRNSFGEFYDSRKYENNPTAKLPKNADANGAYNIARKALWAVEQIKNAEDRTKVNLSISHKEWLKYAQNR